MVTSRDVARLAGVSQATVSRALSDSPLISAATKARVRAAMEQLSYVPHAGAQAMKTRRTNTIGVVVAELTNPFFAEVLDELTTQFAAAGFRVVVWNTGSGSHDDALSAIRERAIDGVVFTTATKNSPELNASIERRSPLVLINRMIDDLDCDQVVSDNIAGARAVADFLVDNSRRRIAYIGGVPDASTSRDRRIGFLGRMEELGQPVPEHLQFAGGGSHERAVLITDRLLSRGSRPDAIFCANDYMAFGALDALRRSGIPSEECWVIGYDDVDMAAWTSFDLTTVRQPSRDMARQGAQMLLTRIASENEPIRKIQLPFELIVRGSTAPIARARHSGAKP